MATTISVAIERIFIDYELYFAIFFYFGVIVGSIFPDLDEEGSYLSLKFPLFPMLLKLFGVTHRGVTHLLLPVIVMASLFILFFNNLEELTAVVLLGFIIGYLLHLCGDMVTKGGINNFYTPFSSKHGVLLPRFMRFYTNSKEEKQVFFLMLIILAIETSIFLF